MTLEVNVVPCRSDNYAYLIRETTTGQTAVVDVPDAAPVLSAIDEKDLRLDRIFLTHHHHDHVEGVEAVRSRTGAKVVGASSDAYRLPALDVAVSEGDSVRLGEAVAEVIDVSGHTVGHIAYVFGTENWAFTGDSLMMMGCGRV
ncbi:MAG: MBL fold metallo-hydrolase, partial [Rhodobacteraceae bacterium]|nr:MBL fold metallo-hydrolase [Paracoccaceae bacterium]